MTAERQSLFQPAVVVYDDGRITIDWADSYSNTVHDDNPEVYTQPDGDPDSTLLDSLVVGFSTADGLRRLADHIEAAESLATQIEAAPK